jgi:hypothetical protein
MSDTVSSSGTSRPCNRSTDTLSCPARDLVARIYHEELNKLMVAAQLRGNMADAAMYRQELLRLAFSRGGGDGSSGVVKPELFSRGVGDVSSGLVKPEPEKSDVVVTNKQENHAAGDSLGAKISEHSTSDCPQDLSSVGGHRVSSLGGGAVSQAGTSDAGCSDDEDERVRAVSGEGLSPLQQMQCIANSLPMVAASQTLVGATATRPVLPPVTNQQLEACEDLNTEELVAKVCELNTHTHKSVLWPFPMSE